MQTDTIRADVRELLETGFRNIDLPPLDERDLADIAVALDFIRLASFNQEAKLREALEPALRKAERESGMTLAEAKKYTVTRLNGWLLNIPDRIPKELRALRVMLAALGDPS